jgi:hypothetical protein
MRFTDGRRVLNQFGIKVARTFDLEKRPCSPRKNVAATSERASQEEHTMKKRKLGSQGLEVAELGLGCMGMSDFYGKADEAESVATIHRALELGVTLLDTADMYGFGENERLVGRAIRGRRDRVVLATKFRILRRKEDSAYRGVSGDRYGNMNFVNIEAPPK